VLEDLLSIDFGLEHLNVSIHYMSTKALGITLFTSRDVLYYGMLSSWTNVCTGYLRNKIF